MDLRKLRSSDFGPKSAQIGKISEKKADPCPLLGLGCSAEVETPRQKTVSRRLPPHYDANSNWPWSCLRRMNHQPMARGIRICARMMHIIRAVGKSALFAKRKLSIGAKVASTVLETIINFLPEPNPFVSLQ